MRRIDITLPPPAALYRATLQEGVSLSTKPAAKKRKPFRLKLTPTEAKLHEWVERCGDPADWAATDVLPLDGQRGKWLRPRDDDLNRHFRRRCLRPISKTLVACHCRGIIGLQITARWPWLPLRFDFDAHNGEKDPERAAHWINEVLFGGRLFVQATRNGWAAWGAIQLPEYVHGATGAVRRHGRVWGNERLLDLEVSIKALLAAERFDVSFEIQGAHTTRTSKYDSLTGERLPVDQRVIMRAQPGCLPRPQSEAEAQVLLDAVFDYWRDIRPIIKRTHLSFSTRPYAVPDAIDSSAVVAPPAGSTPKPKRKRTARRRKPGAIESTGDKNRDRATCVSAAIRMILGRRFDPEEVTDEQRVEIIDLSNDLYEQNGLNGGERDRDRDSAFEEILNKFLGAYDPMIAGRSDLWIGDDDEAIAQRLAHRRIGPVARQKALAEGKGIRGKLTDEVLADVLTCMVKLIHIDIGGYIFADQVPARAALNYLYSRGHTNVNGSLVSAALKLLQKAKLLWPKAGCTVCRGCARRWEFDPKLYRLLPFLRGAAKPSGPELMPLWFTPEGMVTGPEAKVDRPKVRRRNTLRVAEARAARKSTGGCDAAGRQVSYPKVLGTLRLLSLVGVVVRKRQAHVARVVSAEKFRRAA